MRKMMQRVVVTLGAVTVMLGMTIGPAAAAPVNAVVTWDGVSGSAPTVSPSPVVVNSGDVIDLSFSSPDSNNSMGLFSSSDCSGSAVAFVAEGTSTTFDPSSSTAFSVAATNQITFESSACLALDITINSAPPPEVPEVPYAAWLVVASGALFGGGFFLLRRRAARATA
jgi:hypothetical protein